MKLHWLAEVPEEHRSTEAFALDGIYFASQSKSQLSRSSQRTAANAVSGAFAFEGFEFEAAKARMIHRRGGA